MNGIVYLNGEFLEADEAKVSIFDRGFVFGDGIYEVLPVIGGKLIDKANFFERFKNSMAEIEIENPMSDDEWIDMLYKLAGENNIQEGLVYVQVTRGVAPREFGYPAGIKPTVMGYAASKVILDSPYAKTGIKAITVPDVRWKKRNIKSVALLGQCIAKQQAVKAGVYEGWMVEDGFVTEGTSSTAYIVKDGKVITRPLSNLILPGIRRKSLLAMAAENGVEIEERLFTPEEAYEADEAFLTSATTVVYSIIELDGKQIGDGQPGPIAKKLREMYLKMAAAEAK